MRATGIVRRIDDLGRVVIPKEIRRSLGISEGDAVEIYTSPEGGVLFIPYRPNTIDEFSAIKKTILQEAEEYHSTEENAVLNFAFETIEKIMNKGS